MNKPARILSEVDILEAEIRRKTDEIDRISQRLALLRGERPTPALRAVEDVATAPASPARAISPLAEIERRYILEVLAHFGGNRTHTARALGIGTNTLWRKLKAWGEPPARG